MHVYICRKLNLKMIASSFTISPWQFILDLHNVIAMLDSLSHYLYGLRNKVRNKIVCLRMKTRLASSVLSPGSWESPVPNFPVAYPWVEGVGGTASQRANYNI